MANTEKLRTLKDFEERGNIDCERRFNLLRQEAVKHIIFFDKLDYMEINWRNVFLDFINLTSEDLK